MRLIEGLDALLQLDLPTVYGERAADSRSVVAVGVFDGVHLGHQRLLHELLELSATLQATPTAITFANHPDQVLRGEAPPLLVSVPHRLRLLRRTGVRRLVLLQFEPRLQSMTARMFAEQVLVHRLRTRALLLGYDSALGQGREGTPTRFAELGSELGFKVRTGQPFTIDGVPVSSTAIRTAITAGDLQLAQRYLGRFPSTFGEVLRGDGRGRGLGFPTANIAPQTPVLPPHGVYAVEVILDGNVLRGVANLGVRPTFAGRDAVLEVHLFDYQGNLYGRELEVCFVVFLRGERRFADADELRTQIALDVVRARQALRA
ncbi:MAG: riboflavin biosynthesis protein RibF [Planctomycetes bacterium]|nr:riboflavin biosynthesis protein RibF [Planctomycetota bacterium]